MNGKVYKIERRGPCVIELSKGVPTGYCSLYTPNDCNKLQKIGGKVSCKFTQAKANGEDISLLIKGKWWVIENESIA